MQGNRAGAIGYQTAQREAPVFAIGVLALHEKAAANSGMFESGAFTRNRLGAWDSRTADWRVYSGRTAVHQFCA